MEWPFDALAIDLNLIESCLNSSLVNYRSSHVRKFTRDGSGPTRLNLRRRFRSQAEIGLAANQACDLPNGFDAPMSTCQDVSARQLWSRDHPPAATYCFCTVLEPGLPFYRVRPSPQPRPNNVNVAPFINPASFDDSRKWLGSHALSLAIGDDPSGSKSRPGVPSGIAQNKTCQVWGTRVLSGHRLELPHFPSDLPDGWKTALESHGERSDGRAGRMAGRGGTQSPPTIRGRLEARRIACRPACTARSSCP